MEIYPNRTFAFHQRPHLRARQKHLSRKKAALSFAQEGHPTPAKAVLVCRGFASAVCGALQRETSPKYFVLLYFSLAPLVSYRIRGTQATHNSGELEEGMMRAVILVVACCASAVVALPAASRRDDGLLAERLERLERGLLPEASAPLQALSRSERLQHLVRSGHGQLSRWFKDVTPLVECEGERACSAAALDNVTHKSDLWTLPGMKEFVPIIRGNTTFAASIACAAPCSAESFQAALAGLPTAVVPRIAIIQGPTPPRRAPGAPWLTFSPRADAALSGIKELLKAPLAALQTRGNLSLALHVDVCP